MDASKFFPHCLSHFPTRQSSNLVHVYFQSLFTSRCAVNAHISSLSLAYYLSLKNFFIIEILLVFLCAWGNDWDGKFERVTPSPPLPHLRNQKQGVRCLVEEETDSYLLLMELELCVLWDECISLFTNFSNSVSSKER